MRRTWKKPVCLVIAFLLFWCCLFTACLAEKEATEGCYAFTDDSGKEIVIEKKPQRVAVLFSSYAEMWTNAGGEVAATVGESVERGFAKEDVPLVDSGAGKSVDREALLAASPDLVIGSYDIAAQADAAGFFNGIGIPFALFRVDGFSDYKRVMRVFCDLTQDEEAYRVNVEEVGARIDDILSAVPNGESPNILFIRCGSSAGATKAKTAAQNFACAMLDELGAYNVAENAKVLLDGLSVEEILRADPDHIFISTMGDEQRSKAYMDGVLSGEVWRELTAVKTGNYHYLPKELFQYKPNRRWADAYAYLYAILYGEAS